MWRVNLASCLPLISCLKYQKHDSLKNVVPFFIFFPDTKLSRMPLCSQMKLEEASSLIVVNVAVDVLCNVSNVFSTRETRALIFTQPAQ